MAPCKAQNTPKHPLHVQLKTKVSNAMHLRKRGRMMIPLYSWERTLMKPPWMSLKSRKGQHLPRRVNVCCQTGKEVEFSAILKLAVVFVLCGWTQHRHVRLKWTLHPENTNSNLEDWKNNYFLVCIYICPLLNPCTTHTASAVLLFCCTCYLLSLQQGRECKAWKMQIIWSSCSSSVNKEVQSCVSSGIDTGFNFLHIFKSVLYFFWIKQINTFFFWLQWIAVNTTYKMLKE